MSRPAMVRLFLVGFLITALFTGCTRDPNVRKQKFLESGDRFFAQSKYREAVIQYSNALQIDPSFAQAHYQLGEAYLKLGDPSRAYQELQRTIELTPDNYRARLDVANLLMVSSNEDSLKQARVQLDVLREKQPQNPEVLQAWADYYAAGNNLGAALEEMQKAIAADPNRSESYLDLALLQVRSNLPDQAEANFKKAAALDPKAMNAQIALGLFYQQHSRLAEAEQQFKHAISVDPKDLSPREALVRVYIVEGKKAEAEALLKQTKNDLADNSTAYRSLGDYYFGIGDLDNATGEYASLYHDHPKDVVVRKNYVELLILKNRLDDATRLNDEILKSNPHEADALVHRAQMQVSRNDATGAVDSLQEVIKNDSNNGVAHYWLGSAFAQQHNLARAESEWRDAVRLRPDLTEAQRSLASLEMSRGDIDALTQTAQQIIAAAQNAPDGYIYRALAEMSRQKYSDAEQDLRKAMAVAPASPEPYVQMGNLRQAQKQYPEAIKSYQEALDKNPRFTPALQGIMNVYIVQKQPDQAVAAARSQLAKAPSSDFYDLLGTELFARKDFAGADSAFRKALELDQNNSDAVVKLGQAQVAQGGMSQAAMSQALATYLQSIKDHPREIAFYILAAELYDAQGNWEEAKALYQKALDIQPDNALASNNLAYGMLEHGGNVDVALAMAQTARRGMPDSWVFADTLGWAYFQKGVYQSAIDMFQEALRLNEKQGGTDRSTVHYHLGLAYEKANQPAQAKQQLERALKINPNYDDARKALSELRG